MFQRIAENERLQTVVAASIILMACLAGAFYITSRQHGTPADAQEAEQVVTAIKSAVFAPPKVQPAVPMFPADTKPVKPLVPLQYDMKTSLEVQQMYYAALFKSSSSSTSHKSQTTKTAKEYKSTSGYILTNGSNEQMYNNAETEPAVRDFPNATSFLDPTTVIMNVK